jgi:hypothetical protein
MVVISFAPKGAWAKVLGSIFPRLAPWATIFRPSADGLAEEAGRVDFPTACAVDYDLSPVG